jgi:hypothetical protein
MLCCAVETAVSGGTSNSDITAADMVEVVTALESLLAQADFHTCAALTALPSVP